MASDTELALAAADGDRSALADIYDRYADTLYELCRAVLRDSDEASDAVQDTFVIAATRLSALREPERLKSWLCAIARHESIRRSSKRARNRPSHDAALDVPVMDGSADGLIANDAANLVWEAAESLSERECALLMLNVRQGLEGAELAEAAGMPGPAAAVVLSRAKTQLGSAVRATLLIRHGRNECEELNALAPRVHAALDALTRKRVARHAQSCAVCEPMWTASPDALGVLAAAPLLGAPVALKVKVLDDPRLISTSKPLGGGGWKRNGFPPVDDTSRRRILTSLAAALVTILVAVALVLTGDKGTPKLVMPSNDDTATSTTLATDVGAIDLTATTTTSKRLTATTTSKKSTPTTVAIPGAGGTTRATAAPTTSTSPALKITASSRGVTEMTTCRGIPITASTSGGTAPGTLYLHHADATGSSGTVTMSGGPSSWSGTLTIGGAGDYTWWVSDSPFSGGTRSGSQPMKVTACPQ